jgi:hypothetical protein
MSKRESRAILEQSLCSAAAVGHREYYEIEARVGPLAFETPIYRDFFAILGDEAEAGEEFDAVTIAQRLVVKHPGSQADVLDIFEANFEHVRIPYYCKQLNEHIAHGSWQRSWQGMATRTLTRISQRWMRSGQGQPKSGFQCQKHMSSFWHKKTTRREYTARGFSNWMTSCNAV